MARAKHRMVVGTAKTNREIEVEIPEGDIAPWDLNTSFTVVGTDVSRVDGVAKVTGRARYAYDIKRPQMLYAAMLRSPHASAEVTSVDLDAALAMPGVGAAIATKGPDTPFQRVRYAGDDVAAVAAETLDQARDALEKIAVEYTVQPHQTDYLAVDGAPRFDRAGDVTTDWPADEKLDRALEGAEHVHQATYQCQVQTHSSLETHGMVADYHDGELDIWASTQATFAVRRGLARTLQIPENKVRVRAEFVGGGFGSKFQPGAEGVTAALLSRAAKRPVHLLLDRYEEHVCTGNRPAATIQIRAGVDAAGKIKAWDYRSWGGPGFAGRGGTTQASYYLDGAQTRNQQRDLRTDTDAARAMRAPGYPQGIFASESMIDELADLCGMDPLELRLANDNHEIRREEWEFGADRFGWHERRNHDPGGGAAGRPRLLRGAGVAGAIWGQMGRPGNRVTCRIHSDGTVETRNGAQDIGTGMKTVMAILTAEELGIPVSTIAVSMGDTADPIGPGSGGSTTTPSLAPTVRHAAHRAKMELAHLVADHLGVDSARIAFENGEVGDIGAGRMLPFAQACRLIGASPIEVTSERQRNYEGFHNYVCGCQFAEVEVDRETGQVRVLRLLAVQDCGLVIARKLAESQVLGAMIQGLSYALHEQRILDHYAGHTVNGDLLNYKIAGARDMPAMEAVMYSVANGKNNVGAAGLGEPPKVATAGAIANAIANATGARVRSLPITPDKVLAALARKPRGK